MDRDFEKISKQVKVLDQKISHVITELQEHNVHKILYNIHNIKKTVI